MGWLGLDRELSLAAESWPFSEELMAESGSWASSMAKWPTGELADV